MKVKKRGFWNLSNKLTLFRISAIPFIAFLLLFAGKGTSFAAALIFLLAAMSDALDGYMARRRNTVTNVGKLLDPFYYRQGDGGYYPQGGGRCTGARYLS